MIESSKENVEFIWKNIQTTVSDGAKKCLGMGKSTKKKIGFNVNFKEIINRRNKLRESSVIYNSKNHINKTCDSTIVIPTGE